MVLGLVGTKHAMVGAKNDENIVTMLGFTKNKEIFMLEDIESAD